MIANIDRIHRAPPVTSVRGDQGDLLIAFHSRASLPWARCPLSGVKRTGLGLSSPIPIKSGTSCKVSSQQPRLGRLWEDANGFLFQTRKQGRGHSRGGVFVKSCRLPW
jgi:hypothetical protein